MWTRRFDPKEQEIWVRTRVHGSLGMWDVDCMLDIGTSITIISSAIQDARGCGADMGKEVRQLVSPGGIRIPGTTLHVHLEFLGLDLPVFEMLPQEIFPDHYGAEGLSGMDIVEGRILTIDGKASLASLEA